MKIPNHKSSFKKIQKWKKIEILLDPNSKPQKVLLKKIQKWRKSDILKIAKSWFFGPNHKSSLKENYYSMQIFNNLVVHLSPALAVPDPWSNLMKRNLQFDSFSKFKIKVLLSTWNLGLHVLSSRMTMTSWSLTSSESKIGESKTALITVFDLSSRSQMISFLKQGEMDCFDRSNHHLSPALSDSNPDPWSKSNEGPTWTTPWWWGGYKTCNRRNQRNRRNPKVNW